MIWSGTNKSLAGSTPFSSVRPHCVHSHHHCCDVCDVLPPTASGGSVVYSTTAGDAIAEGLDQARKAHVDSLHYAGHSYDDLLKREEVQPSLRVSQPPGGVDQVRLSMPADERRDENPRARAPGTFAPVSEVAKYKLALGVPAGIKCVGAQSEDWEPPMGKKLMQVRAPSACTVCVCVCVCVCV